MAMKDPAGLQPRPRADLNQGIDGVNAALISGVPGVTVPRLVAPRLQHIGNRKVGAGRASLGAGEGDATADRPAPRLTHSYI